MRCNWQSFIVGTKLFEAAKDEEKDNAEKFIVLGGSKFKRWIVLMVSGGEILVIINKGLLSTRLGFRATINSKLKFLDLNFGFIQYCTLNLFKLSIFRKDCLVYLEIHCVKQNW